MEQITPLYDQVLLQLEKAPEKTAHGLFVAEDKANNTNRGVIKAVGPGLVLENGDRVNIDVNVGDTVIFGRMHSGQPIKVNGEDGFFLMGARDLLATIRITEGN